MRPSLTLKTLYRSPVRTILTFVLLGVVTFAFFSQTAEYAVTAREIANAAERYVGVGSAEVAPANDQPTWVFNYLDTDPRVVGRYTEQEQAYYRDEIRYQPLTQAQIDALSALPYVTSTDTRYMTAGVSSDYYRPDDGTYFSNYTTWCVFEATLSDVYYGGAGAGSFDETEEFIHYNEAKLEDCNLLTDTPYWAEYYETLNVIVSPIRFDSNITVSSTQHRSFMTYTSNYIYDTAYFEALTLGERYTFVLCFDPLLDRPIYNPLSDTPLQTNQLWLGNYPADTWCEAVWPLEGAPADYLDTAEYAPLRELIEIMDTDAHTFDIVYTEDMRAIKRFNEGDMAIAEGRALTREDSENGSEVCVISREFAAENELAVGDTITMALGTALFEQYKGLGAVAATYERYEPADKSVTLEIVGVYADVDGGNAQSKEANWSYSVSTVFVPKSLLPVDASALTDHVFSPAEFSFMVENAWDFKAFLAEATPKIEEMGLTLVFSDAGWSDIEESFQSAKQVALIKIAVLFGAVVAATSFIVYLFIGRKKKEYAVMRALGTTTKLSARTLLLPLGAVTITAVLVGSAAGWIYTAGSVARNNMLTMMEETAVSTAIPAAVVLGCVLGEILLTLLIAVAMLRRIGALSPLALLQDSGSDAARKKKARLKNTAAPDAPPPSTDVEKALRQQVLSAALEPVSKKPGDGAVRFVLRYIRRHMRRSVGKSLLAVILAALLFAAVGQFILMKQSYTDLCENTEITASFAGGVPLSVVPSLEKTGYVTDPYYVAEAEVGMTLSLQSIIITNNIERFTGETVEIAYADGYDAASLTTLGAVVFVGQTLMDIYGLEIGDTVTLIVGYSIGAVQEYITNYRANHPDNTESDEELLTRLQDKIQAAAFVQMQKFTIAGAVSTPSGEYNRTLFTPGNNDPTGVLNKSTRLEVAQFKLADFHYAAELHAYGDKVVGGNTGSRVSFVMDTSKLEGPAKTLRLLETLYPIAVAAALIIGGFLCCLVILQSSKEAAILRILGTTKRKTRAILSIEQILLSVIGLIVGAVAVAIYKGAALVGAINQLLLFAGLYFVVIVVAAIVSASLATRRNVLELLQTKE